jgi:hypothetical protein
MIPANRQIFSKAELIIATTPETGRLLRHAGAARTAVQFPDVFEPASNQNSVVERRRGQCSEISGRFRLVWSGRLLWWKGAQLAVEFLRRLQVEGSMRNWRSMDRPCNET